MRTPLEMRTKSSVRIAFSLLPRLTLREVAAA